jgi:hypothetical protein
MYFAWKSGNRVQDAVRDDANARIAQVREDGEVAKREFDRQMISAGEKIASLNQQSEQLKLDAESARREIVTAQVEAARANERAAIANEKAEKLKVEAESLRVESFALQRIMRPRLLYNNAQGREALDKFAGMRAIIFVAQDGEAQTFAESIASVLNVAKWKLEIRKFSGSFGDDGVKVCSGEETPPDQAWLAGQALAELLTKNFAATATGSDRPVAHLGEDEMPPTMREFSRPAGIVAIVVGRLPIWENLAMLQHRPGAFKSQKKPRH